MDSLKSFVSGTDSNVGKCSDQEILKAAPQRTDALKFVKMYADPVLERVKPWMIETKVPKSVIDEVTGYFDKELKWWENTKLCEIDIKTRLTAFQEKVEPFLKSMADKVWPTLEAMKPEERKKAIDSCPLRGWREIFEEKNKGVVKKETEIKKEKQEKIQKRGFRENVIDGVSRALTFLLIIIWILLALRFGGFAASDLLYKPTAYRVLSWVYTVIFTPIFIPYYGYKQVRYYAHDLLKRLGIVSEEPELPRFESLFAFLPYNPDETISYGYKFFGYPSTVENEKWVKEKQDEQNMARADFVAGTQDFLGKIIKAKEDSLKEA